MRDPEGAVVIVDDEPIVLRLIEAIFLRRGYRTLAALSADHAWRLLAAHSGPVRLLITDVLMPGADGLEFARAFRERLPGVPVLFIYGSPDHPLVRKILDSGEAALAKPFLPVDLMSAAESLLAAVA
jgi:CheY-like chemotaxis protein